MIDLKNFVPSTPSSQLRKDDYDDDEKSVPLSWSSFSADVGVQIPLAAIVLFKPDCHSPLPVVLLKSHDRLSSGKK